LGQSDRINDFKTDLEYSLESRENEIFDKFYFRAFSGLVQITFVSDITTQKRGIDKLLNFDNGKVVSIDEKKRRTNYGDIALELWSVWEQRKRGWLYTSEADYIIYAIMPVSKVYLLPTLLLRNAWLKNEVLWTDKYREVRAYNKTYVTISRAIPPAPLLNAIKEEMNQSLSDNERIEFNHRLL